MINYASLSPEYAPYQATTAVQTLGAVDPERMFEGDRNDTFQKTETYVAQPIDGAPLQEATDVVVKLQPFGSGAAGQHAMHGKVSGEAAGKIPVVTLASFPRAEVFTEEQRERISQGDFQPYADAYSRVIRAVLKAYGREDKIAKLGLLGTSLGAAILPHLAPLLEDAVGEITSVGAKSPGNIGRCHWITEQRRLAKTPAKDYAKAVMAVPELVPHYAKALDLNLDGMSKQDQLEAIHKAQQKIVQMNLLSNKALAFASGQGLSRGHFEERFGVLMDNDPTTTDYSLGFGTKDGLFPPKPVNKAFEAFQRRKATLDVVEIRGNHAIWDNPREIASFSCYALRRMSNKLVPATSV